MSLFAEHQGPRRYAACKVEVDGIDVTARLRPYLISLQIIDTFEGGLDQCNIELDDRNAELMIPPDEVALQAYLGWSGEGPRPFLAGATSDDFNISEERRSELRFGGPGMQLLFSGKVSNVESGFGRRGGGRRMWIEATSSNMKGAAKQIQKLSLGEGKQDDAQQGGGKMIPLKQVMEELAKKAGVSVQLSPGMEGIERDYWYINDSFQNFGQRMANELGGLFKITNGIGILIGKNEGVNTMGATLPTVEAIWGINLIGWRIKPFVGRPQHSAAHESFFKLFDAEWSHAMAAIGGEIPFGGAGAIAKQVGSVADQLTGSQKNSGTGADTDHKRGTGWALINGDPRCRAGNTLHISGARPGVDGNYFMSEVEHNYTRGVGYTTRINLKNPRADLGGFDAWGERRRQQAAQTAAQTAAQPQDIPVDAFGTLSGSQRPTTLTVPAYPVRGISDEDAAPPEGVPIGILDE